MVVTCGTIQIEIANQTVVLKKDQALFINTNVVHKIEGLEADTSFTVGILVYLMRQTM